MSRNDKKTLNGHILLYRGNVNVWYNLNYKYMSIRLIDYFFKNKLKK